MFHAVLRAIGHTLHEFPRLNRFTMGSRYFQREGIWLAFEVEDVDAEYERLGKVLPIHTAIRDEPWGERHFVVRDPSGASVNVMTMKH